MSYIETNSETDTLRTMEFHSIKHIQRLSNDNLDIIGDIHGEFDTLIGLLHQLGYDENGNHLDNRTIVFIGDFVDRWSSTTAVIRLARRLMNKGEYLMIKTTDIAAIKNTLQHILPQCIFIL